MHLQAWFFVAGSVGFIMTECLCVCDLRVQMLQGLVWVCVISVVPACPHDWPNWISDCGV